jgi:hypothetical protein
VKKEVAENNFEIKFCGLKPTTYLCTPLANGQTKSSFDTV